MTSVSLSRRDFLRGIAAAAPLACAPWLLGAEEAKKRLNLLFIMTDQQRFDTLGCAGNKIIKTPNLDRLAREGAWFQRAYTTCPVCAPARTSLLTGRNIDTTKVRQNDDCAGDQAADLPTFDMILAHNGYKTEYHGKYHSPYRYALEYSRPVRWLNTGTLPAEGGKADMSEADAFRQFLNARLSKQPLKAGEFRSRCGPYVPDPLDGHVLFASRNRASAKAAKAGKNATKAPRASEGSSYGCLDVPTDCTHTAFTATEGLEALDRLKDGPFSLTISIGPPHPPMLAAKPYYGMYPPESLPVPASIGDPRTNSPYLGEGGKTRRPEPYRDPSLIRGMISDYYGLITEDDDWVGKILAFLDEHGLADRTLVVFTSDHGEMLGDHGMHSKQVFYEGSAHIPLLMRLPGVIPAGAVVSAPVSHLDLFATILDYLGIPAPESDGASLRPLIEGKDVGAGRFVVSESPAKQTSSFMVFDGRWKLIFGAGPEVPMLDALYDLGSDPNEVNNRIGANPNREACRAEAERMKGLLVGWLERVRSPHLEGVKARPVIRDISEADLTQMRKRAAKAAPRDDDE